MFGKIPDLPAAPSMAVFKKWRHDFELFLETIGSSWKGVTAVLRASRLYEQTFEKDQLPEVEALSAKHEPKAPTLDYSFDFDLKTDALYKLLMPRLPVALATEFRQVGQTNGFELYRRLVQKLDPPRADASFHLSNEIRGLGASNLCKDFAHTVQFVKFLDSRMDEYRTETGEVFPDSDAARVLAQAIDEDEMGRVEDTEGLDLKDPRDGYLLDHRSRH